MTAFRIDPENGKFQVKVRQNPGGEAMWFDAGDPCDTQSEAETKMQEFIDGEIVKYQLVDDENGIVVGEYDSESEAQSWKERFLDGYASPLSIRKDEQ